ncbi:MAG: helix-turn-helix domain-containing protein [Gammaproteobacteria bacterium]|jgi:cytoskeleton protein RodZ
MVASKAQETEAQDANAAKTLGVKLKSARESQELSIEAVEAELRISAELLEALERDQLDALGAPVFAKGYLKQYGARLGLDVDELLADYDGSAGNPNVDIRPLTEFRLRDQRSNAPWIVAGIVLLAVVASILLWFTLGSGSNLVS